MKLPISSYQLSVIRIQVLTFLLTATCLLLTAQPVSAQVSLVVSPPRYDAEVMPGETIQKTVKVTNNSQDSSISLRAIVTDFIVQDDAGTPLQVTENASGRYLASPWFTLDQSEFTLAPKETAELVALVTVPADALPGGHYAGVFFESVTDSKIPGSASLLTAQVGSLFGITIKGDLTYDALIKDFSVGSRLYEYGPVEFSAIIENQSDTHIRPDSKIVIHDMLGRQLEEIALDSVNIFPYTTRTLSGIWNTSWGFGRYTATLEASYGPGLVADRLIYFWILPYRLIIALLIILATLLVIYISVRRHLAHRGDTRDAEIDELKRKISEMENRQ